jgi:hypothetical protein
MQTTHSINFVHPGKVSQEGQRAVWSLKCALYGEQAGRTNVLELVAFVSMARVSEAGHPRRVFISILKNVALCVVLETAGICSS